MKSDFDKRQCETPEGTFALGENIATTLRGGEIIFLTGTLGAGKTLLTKGIVSALGFEADDVTSPSFTLVNLYKTESFDVYHIDLWRIKEANDALFAVGLDEILENENAIVIIEWAERLGKTNFDRKIIDILISGDGDDRRRVIIRREIEAAHG